MTATEFRNSSDVFTKACLEAALWASSAERGECETCQSDRVIVDPQTEKCMTCGGAVSGTDRSFSLLDMDEEQCAPKTLDQFVRDCKDFQAEHAYLLTRWYVACSETPESAGHDLWLTRCGHGTGYWDRWASGTPQGKIGSLLTDAAKGLGNVDLYLGDDGLIYRS